MLFILDIPISAQVVSVADVYDALTSNRVYKRAFSHEKAMQMILDGECGQFNPVLLLSEDSAVGCSALSPTKQPSIWNLPPARREKK